MNNPKFFKLFLIISLFLAIYCIGSPNILMDKEAKQQTTPCLEKHPLDLIKDYTPPSEPALGFAEAVVIMIDFSDQVGVKSQAYFEIMLFGGIDGSLDDYYEEASYNKFTINGSIAGSSWYRSAYTKVYYGANGADIDDANGPIYELAREAAILANNDVDFSEYDTNGDGTVDHLLVIFAGDCEATSGQPNDIWSHRWNIYGTPLYLDGVRIFSYTMQSENSALGTYAHEFGHDIGLPDLYDIDYITTFVRHWGLMDAGGYNDNGAHPSHMTAWSKMQLGWIEGTKIISVADGLDRTCVLAPLESSASSTVVIKLPISTDIYFLIENRQQIGYDSYLPDQGIIISFVNETLDTGKGIVKVIDSRPSSIAYPNDLDDAEFGSETGDVVIYRNSDYDFLVTVTRKIGNSYEVHIDRANTPTYLNYSFPMGDYFIDWDDQQAGRIITWNWYCSNPSQNIDFWIKKNDSATLYERIDNVNSDGGSFRVPTTGTWELHWRNDVGGSIFIYYDSFSYYVPNLAIYNFYENPSVIYVDEYFDLLLTVYNTGGSFVEGALANLTLPAGLSTNQLTREIGIINYYEYITVSWRIYGSASGTHLIQLSVTSLWGGIESDTEWVTVSVDNINPTVTITSPNDGLVTVNDDIVIDWIASDSQTGIASCRLYLDLNPAIILYNSSYIIKDLAEGTHSIRIRAYDNAGGYTDDIISVTVDYSNPSLAQLTSISNGQTISGAKLITASALDSFTNIDRVEFWDGLPGIGTLLSVDIDSGDGWSFLWNTSLVNNGGYTIYIRVYDELGHYLDSSGVSITVYNAPVTPTDGIDPLTIILLVALLAVAGVAGTFVVLWAREKKSSTTSYSSKFIPPPKSTTQIEHKLKYTTPPPPPLKTEPLMPPPPPPPKTEPLMPPSPPPTTEIKCPDCNSLLSTTSIQMLKMGHTIFCPTCDANLTPKLLELPLTGSETDLVKDQTPSSRIPEDLGKGIDKISAAQLLDEDITKLEEALQLTEADTPVKFMSKPTTSPIEAQKLVAGSSCPYCNETLPVQKVENLQKGISVFCPNCLKSIKPKKE